MGGVKHDSGKPALGLLPAWVFGDPWATYAIYGYYRIVLADLNVSWDNVCKVLEHGAAKYGENNWKGVTPHSRYLHAALRHLFRLDQDGKTFVRRTADDLDPDSGFPHWWHAAACLVFLQHFKTLNTDIIPKAGETRKDE